MTRARDLGISIGDLRPGPFNAITDVAGVRVGHATIIEGDGPLVPGKGPVRTGVTVIIPRDGSVWDQPLFAGCHRLNGNGELTGLEWLRESGMLMSVIGITNTHSVGVVRDTLVQQAIKELASEGAMGGLPIVGETWDGTLSDVNGQHVGPEHVWAAVASAASGPVPEGNVGGGTGMICHGFKGGIGTASRVLDEQHGGYTIGVLVQANYGIRARLRVDGVPVGREIPPSEVPLPDEKAPAETGSIIVIVATDAPLLPFQCDRVAQRAALGIGRMGGAGGHFSGDLILTFATGNKDIPGDFGDHLPLTAPLTMFVNAHLDELFFAVIEAVEESILNALVAAETMTGRDGITAHRLPHDRLIEVMRTYGRPPTPHSAWLCTTSWPHL